MLIGIRDLMASFHPSSSRLILAVGDPQEPDSENWHLRPPLLLNSPLDQFQWLASLKLNMICYADIEFQLQKVINDYLVTN